MTAEQKAACDRLSEIWKSKQKILGLTQESAAEKLGITQGAVGHNLKGRTAISLRGLAGYSRLLDVPPEQIDPVLAQQLRATSSPSNEVRDEADPSHRGYETNVTLTADEKRLLGYFRRMTDQFQREFLGHAMILRTLSTSDAKSAAVQEFTERAEKSVKKRAPKPAESDN